MAKKLSNFRLSEDVQGMLEEMSRKTGHGKTLLVESAIDVGYKLYKEGQKAPEAEKKTAHKGIIAALQCKDNEKGDQHTEIPQQIRRNYSDDVVFLFREESDAKKE